MTEATKPLAFISSSRGAVFVSANLKHFCKLCLVGIEEDAQLDMPPPTERLLLVLYSEVGRLCSPMVSLFLVAHTLHFSPPVRLDADDPADVGLQVVVEGRI